MPIATRTCPVLGATVTLVTDLEGTVNEVICREYEQGTGRCRLKMTAREGGPLSRFLEQVAEGSLASRSTRCVLRAD